jgi:hypothetical protein
MKLLAALMAVTVLVCLLGTVGNSDYEMALASEHEYCLNVEQGVHRNYNNISCARWSQK